jgi:hypothetical protein
MFPTPTNATHQRVYSPSTTTAVSLLWSLLRMVPGGSKPMSRSSTWSRVSFNARLLWITGLGWHNLTRSFVKRPLRTTSSWGSGPIGQHSACHNTPLYQQFIDSWLHLVSNKELADDRDLVSQWASDEYLRALNPLWWLFHSSHSSAFFSTTKTSLSYFSVFLIFHLRTTV